MKAYETTKYDISGFKEETTCERLGELLRRFLRGVEI